MRTTSRMLEKAIRPAFAKAMSGRAKARGSETAGLSAEASAKAEAYCST